MTKVFRTKKKTPESEIIQQLKARYDNIDEAKINKFSNLPLSKQTLKGLTENKFITVTDIQRQSIGLALKGHDILGAAKTGSGKTLAFLVPILEILYCNQWTHLDGLGALIITPTRELAYQIFETVKKIAKYHNFTIGLIIGGKNVKEEKKSMHRCNIIIATPGRLLQHMDENSLFDCVTMKLLVLDEADRCLDMGFEQTMNAIIENLPPERQTLLFSATQTKSVKNLARLSLKDPLYVSVHELATHTTPDGLQQSYIICELEEKISVLWSFLRNHSKQKILVFFASCKQVKYIFDAFCRLRPGISLLVLHGKMNQFKRLEIYNSFCRKERAVLFATDVAARGLDFPAVDWVIQMDCPADVDTYIHRSGRTARFQKSGESLLVITPSEEPIIGKLQEKKIPINKIQINPNKLQSPQRKLEALLTRDVALKECAQRAVIAYVKTIFLMEDKSIFNVNNIDAGGLSRSLGLAIPPRIRFLQRMQKNQTNNGKGTNKEKNNSYKFSKKDQMVEECDGEESDASEKQIASTSFNSNKMSSGRNDHFRFPSDDDDDDDELLTVKRTIFRPEENEEDEEEMEDTKSKDKKAVTKAAIAKKILKKKIVANKKTNFDEEGQEIIDPTKSKVSELAREYENEEASGINIMLAKKIMLEEDRFDKRRYKDILKQRRLEKKKKLKAQRKGEDAEDGPKVKVYGGNDSETDNEAGSFDSADYDSGPDLSWLPDPDKIYGKQKGSDEEQSDSEKQTNDSDENNSNSDEIQSEDERIHRPKRKLVTMDEHKRKKKRRSPSISDNENLQADEELALQLLRK